MIKHFKKVQSPLNSLGKYPTLEDQTLRFESAGWKTAFARSLWDLWSDDSFLSPQSRISLDEVEPFDEWEEFALFSSHYSLLYAENSGSFTTEPGMRPFLPSLPLDANISVLDSSTPISLKFKEASQYLGLRRFGSAFSLGEDAIAFHGGMGPDTRLDSSEIVTQGSARLEQVAKVPAPGKARMCHTISMVGNGKHLLVGGRASPDAAFADCWLLSSGSWHPVQPLPTPRYRHCAVSVREINVLIFGGKDSAGNPLKESLLWDEEEGWKHLQMAGTQPQARFGASMGALSTTSGILFGGMTGSGTILNDLWEWQLDAKQACISFRDRSDDLSTIPGAAECYARFGATLVQHWGATLVIGGVSSNSLLRKEHEIMAIDTTTFRPKLLPRSESIPRPLLVGCAIHTDGSETLIFGGGAVCYAFGMYWNRGIWVLGESDDSKHSWKFQDIHANSKGLGAGGKPQSENSAPSEKAPLSLP
ncbi:MAG: Suppressor of the cold-sensitive snRNP biogenesis mutant brr1-1 [Chaenotheca gracillima]|nr:MAG: Suppressor of the cold-sensitive snRNP biogenesis mutant brr1-1 [Chaenotheca gracillima]